MKYSLHVLLGLLLIEVQPAMDYALLHLKNYPGLHEWVQIPNGYRTIHSFAMYPGVAERYS